MEEYPRCDSDTVPETDYETETSTDTSSLGPIIRPVKSRSRQRPNIFERKHKFFFRLGSKIESQTSIGIFFTLLCFFAQICIQYCANNQQNLYALQRKINPGVNISTGWFAANILTTSKFSVRKKELLKHKNVLEIAINTKINTFERDWTLDDICHRSVGLNTHQTQVTDKVTKWANSVVPCEVITPIDCFSDGAELLVYDTEYYIYDERNDRESKFNWTTYPLLDTNRNITDVLGYEFRNVQGYRDKPAISDLQEPEEVSNVLRNGCSGVSQQWNKNQLVSNNTLQSSIHIMSADTLYQHYAENGVKSFIIPKINSNGRRPPKIWWSPEKASEVLEEWLKQLIEDIESQEETYFFSPNFIQLENLSIKDIVRQHSEVLLFNCLAAAFAFVLLRFNNILLTILLFILINIVIFGSYTVAWAAIILYQALEGQWSQLDPIVSHVGSSYALSFGLCIAVHIMFIYGHFQKTKSSVMVGELYVVSFPTILQSLLFLTGVCCAIGEIDSEVTVSFGKHMTVVSVALLLFVCFGVPKLFVVHKIAVWFHHPVTSFKLRFPSCNEFSIVNMIKMKSEFPFHYLCYGLKSVVFAVITSLATVGLFTNFTVGIYESDFYSRNTTSYHGANLQRIDFPVQRNYIELENSGNYNYRRSSIQNIMNEITAYAIEVNQTTSASLKLESFWYYDFINWTKTLHHRAQTRKAGDKDATKCHKIMKRRQSDLNNLSAKEWEYIIIHSIMKQPNDIFDENEVLNEDVFDSLLLHWIHIYRGQVALQNEFLNPQSKLNIDEAAISKWKTDPCSNDAYRLILASKTAIGVNSIKLPFQLSTLNDAEIIQIIDNFDKIGNTTNITISGPLIGKLKSFDGIKDFQNIIISKVVGIATLSLLCSTVIHLDAKITLFTMLVWFVSLFQITGLLAIVGVRFNQLVMGNILLSSVFPVLLSTLSIVDVKTLKTFKFYCYSLVASSLPLAFTIFSDKNFISRFYAMPILTGIIIGHVNTIIFNGIIPPKCVPIQPDWLPKRKCRNAFQIDLSIDDRNIMRQFFTKKDLSFTDTFLHENS